MRRADLIIPYAEPTKEKNDTDFSSTLSSTLPMAAVGVPFFLIRRMAGNARLT
ncbi:MAG: hypothetical protein LQ337_003358 [Flavoplaca oasis]|nr:MAG: hypothetical protein LQ337_003358 [Flavoplaca oasis]